MGINIGKFLSRAFGGLLGGGGGVKKVPPQILPRGQAQNTFAKSFFEPFVFGVKREPVTLENGMTVKRIVPDENFYNRMLNARDSYVNAYNDYGNRIQGLLNSLLQTPTISTPFGNLPAYGLQKAGLLNTMNWANLAKDALITPKQVAYDVYYQQPLNMFMQQDLARYGVKADAIYKPRDYGILPSLITAGGMIGAAII